MRALLLRAIGGILLMFMPSAMWIFWSLYTADVVGFHLAFATAIAPITGYAILQKIVVKPIAKNGGLST